MEIVRELAKSLANMVVTDPDSGARFVTSEMIQGILSLCDDPDHAREPLAQAVYEFILERSATVVLPHFKPQSVRH